MAGFSGFPHIGDREKGGKKDFSSIIEHAKKCQPPVEIEKGEIVGGFAHAQVFALADKVVDAVKAGQLKILRYGRLRRTDEGPQLLYRICGAVAEGYRDTYGGLCQVPLQQAAPWRYRRHTEGT
jgi:hypothetical protein